MAKDIFSKWDESVDTEGLANDVKEAAENGTGSFKEVPHGDYEVAVNKLELVASKKGDPMVSIWFKIVSDGEYKGSMIFFNQVITQGFQIHIVNELLRAMTDECEDAPVIEFKTYKQYSELLMDVFESIDDNFEFALKYGKGKKDFSTYEITDVFCLED
nr:DUF669 domain-containing protein [uncultured Anaerocolumna sp.]